MAYLSANETDLCLGKGEVESSNLSGSTITTP